METGKLMPMGEVCRITGLTPRTLQYYDRIGLLKATAYKESGYRLYDEAALERLQQILLFRELEFPLKDIQKILDSPDFDRDKALRQQIELLELKKEHFENLIRFARGIRNIGGRYMDFSAFDRNKQAQYARQAKESWGETDAYKEFEKKSQGRSQEAEEDIAAGLMEIFAQMGKIKSAAPESPEAQTLVKALQDFITGHYYHCTNQILKGLGQMYVAGDAFTENIDAVGGPGTAEFANRAIEVYCK